MKTGIHEFKWTHSIWLKWWLECYWVVIRVTIVSIIRLPLGHEHRSMCGFLILSDNSWSNSVRNSLTSSAIWKIKWTDIITQEICRYFKMDHWMIIYVQFNQL